MVSLLLPPFLKEQSRYCISVKLSLQTLLFNSTGHTGLYKGTRGHWQNHTSPKQRRCKSQVNKSRIEKNELHRGAENSSGCAQTCSPAGAAHLELCDGRNFPVASFLTAHYCPEQKPKKPKISNDSTKYKYYFPTMILGAFSF